MIRPGGLDITAYAVEKCGFAPGSRLLDIGCGKGATVNLLRNRYNMQPTGIDSSQKLLTHALAGGCDLDLRSGDAQQLPFSPLSFDGVLMECVLSLMPEPLPVLQEACRVLKEGGKMILSDFYYRRPIYPPAAEGERCLQQAWFVQGVEGVSTCLNGIFYLPALCALVEEAGFRILLWEDRTRALKELTAELIFKYGSAEQLWKTLFPACSGQVECPGTGNDWKVGYFLALLQK